MVMHGLLEIGNLDFVAWALSRLSGAFDDGQNMFLTLSIQSVEHDSVCFPCLALQPHPTGSCLKQ
jgi:hypothetical protein